MHIFFLGCSDALGMASGEIKDYQLTASSAYSETQPNQARYKPGKQGRESRDLTLEVHYLQKNFGRF